ncbi:MAG: gamma-glutamyltransferase family protein [Solirubrobacteraceae bacterium]
MTIRTERNAELGVIAAGHLETARAGAEVLRWGGNAVDAALGAMLASFACEALLTGLGAGGYMLVVAPGQDPVLLDFFVEAPGRGIDASSRAELRPITVSFGDAIQVFNIGAASVGTYGTPAGIAEACTRFGRVPLSELVAPAARLAREGVPLTRQQAYVFAILKDIVTATPESAALFAPEGRVPHEGELVRQPDLADTLELLAAEGAAPFYTGEIARAAVSWVGSHSGILTARDLEQYAVVPREPVHTSYRARTVVTNPPPSAGGILIAHALGWLDTIPGPPDTDRIVAAMERTQSERTPEFLEGLADSKFVRQFLERLRPERGSAPNPGTRGAAQEPPLGSTTHIAVLDRGGWACSVTCSNGSCSGIVVPGTGIHLNNMLGEQDLNPLGFHRHPPGRRLPSMMAPTIVLRDGEPELALGSAGSNRIRSAILQTIVRVIDERLPVRAAVHSPRVHFEDGVVYAEPGIETEELEAAGRAIGRFGELNLFFGGVQAVAREPDGRFGGAGDPRRGGAAIVVDGTGA